MSIIRVRHPGEPPRDVSLGPAIARHSFTFSAFHGGFGGGEAYVGGTIVRGTSEAQKAREAQRALTARKRAAKYYIAAHPAAWEDPE